MSKLEFDKRKHSYSINGQKLTGVTAALSIIAKPALIVWAAKMAAEYIENTLEAGVTYDEVQIKQLARDAQWAHRSVKEGAADSGTLVHEWIENHFRGMNPKMPTNEGMKKAIKAFNKWQLEQDIEVIEVEPKMYSLPLQLAGTADLVCKLNGKLTIIDFKTGSGIYPEQFLQLGAYAEMYEYLKNTKVEQVGIVNCSVKAPFRAQFSNKVPTFKRMYKEVLKLYRNMDKLSRLTGAR